MPTDKERLDWIDENIAAFIRENTVTIDISTRPIRGIIDDELSNEAERAYDLQQESLMEGGGGPSLIEQQQAAYKIKHGLR